MRDAGDEADDRPNARQQAAEEGGRRTPAGEELLGLIDLVLADQEVLAPSVQERPAQPGAEEVAEERAGRVGRGADDDDAPEVPVAVGERFDGSGIDDLPAREREDEFGGKRQKG